VGMAVDVKEAASWGGDPDPIKRKIAHSIPPHPEGDIFVVPKKFSVFDEKSPAGFGTSHGTPWDYDTSVPVLILGGSVPNQEITEPLGARRVTATIAALLRIPPPARAHVAPLPGVQAVAPSL